MTTIKLRRGTASEWTSANPVLAQGEPGLETDTGYRKYGDGVTPWNELGYAPVPTASLPSSVVSISSGEAPGALGWGVFPSDSDYMIVAADGGAGAVNTYTGHTDYSVSSGDHCPVFQSALTALRAAQGGTVKFRGSFNFATQLVVPDGVSLVGDGLVQGVGASTVNSINSTYNGSAILISDASDTGIQALTRLQDFYLSGTPSKTSQNGIEVNSSAGWGIQDIYLVRIGIFNMGLDGLLLDGGTAADIMKVWCYESYIEAVGRHAINHNSNYAWLRIRDPHIALNNSGYSYYGQAAGLLQWFGGIAAGGYGLMLPAPASTLAIEGAIISGTASGYPGIWIPEAYGDQLLTGITFNNCGGGSTPQLQADGHAQIVLVGNNFNDGRTSPNNVTNHVVLAKLAAMGESIVEGNLFQGSHGDAIAAPSGTTLGPVLIGRNAGYSDVKGQLATPFAGSKISLAGSSAAPSASTTYTCQGSTLMLSVSGGEGVSITIMDPAGNTVQSGLSTYNALLAPGYTMNFGAFTAAPTVYAGVL